MAIDVSNRSLLFSDEMNAPNFWEASLAPTGVWRDNYGYGGVGDYKFNDELQIYTGPYFQNHKGDFNDGNHVYNGDGTLSLIAKKSTNPEVLAFNQGGYSSGMITTRGLEPWLGGPSNQFSFQYGYVEARIDPSEEQGAWNAFWMLPAGGDSGGWAYAEPDIMEKVGQERWTWNAQHGAADTGQYATGIDTSSGFHTYGLDWTPTKMTWYIDGIQTFQIDTPVDMHQHMIVIANLAVGGSWAGTPNFGADGKAEMKIDYIKVWGQDGSGSGVQAPPPAPAPAPQPAPAPAPVLEPASTVSVVAKNAVVNEGASGTTYAQFAVTRSGDLSGPTTVDYAIAPSGASGADGADFVGGALPSGRVWFGAGESSKTIWVPIAGDRRAEADEGFTLTLVNPTGAGITAASASASVTIRNDDGAYTPPPSAPAPAPAPTSPAPAPPPVQPAPAGPTLAITTPAQTVIEGDGGSAYAVYNVARTGDLSGPSTAQWAVSGVGAAAADAQDFVGGLPTGAVWFGAGEALKQIWIPIAGDGLAEANETYLLSLSSLTGASGGVLSVNGMIGDDDGWSASAPPAAPADPIAVPAPAPAPAPAPSPATTVSIAAQTVSQAENDAGVSYWLYQVTRTGDLSGPTTARYEVAGSGTLPADAADFEGGMLPSGTVYFGGGEATKTIWIGVKGDTRYEGDETFGVRLSETTGAVLGNSLAQGVILNDEVPLLGLSAEASYHY